MSRQDFALAVRMKEYEAAARTTLPRRLPVILRVDGRAFHTYLRNADKPFDMSFMTIMGEVAQKMCEGISGAVMAYHQSDEISILICDYPALDMQPWFSKEVQKLVSITASMATAHFCAGAMARGGMTWRGGPSVPMFDARVFVLPDAVETANYFVWRQKDAIRNAVSMAAQSAFSPAQLHGVNTEGMKAMLAAEGLPFDDWYPDEIKQGQYVRHIMWTPRPTASVPEPVTRSGWVVSAAPLFKAEPGNVLTQMIPNTSTFGEGNGDG